MSLVEISQPHFDIETDIAYATANNFTGAPVYARAATYLHRDAADALAEAIRLAAVLGLRFRIFDALRPTEAQWALWSHTPDPEFLADAAAVESSSSMVRKATWRSKSSWAR